MTTDSISSQSAMEYILTYGWAILIISIVLGALLYLGVFTPGALVNSQCVTQADFSCLSSTLSENGMISFNIQQNTMTNINITAVSCNETVSYASMVTLTPQVTLPIGSNHSFSGIQCYTSKGAAYSGSIGSVFNGYILLNYTDVQSGFLHTEYITIVEKIT